MDDDEDQGDDHDQHRAGRITHVSQITAKDASLSLERRSKTVLEQAQLEKMGFNPILDFPYTLLVGSVPEDKKHEQSSQEGDEDHPVPWTETTKWEEKKVKKLAKQKVEYPHL